MNPIVKSLLVVIAAVACAAVAYVTRPTLSVAPLEEVGDKLFPEFKDVTRVRALEVVRPDTAGEKLDPLRIERRGGRWLIASHQDYPADAADAKDRIIDAALELQDLKVLNVQSDVAKDHPLYGVVEPTEEALDAGPDEEGIGTLIRVENSDGERLAEIIVGKSPSGEPRQRFVRRPGQARVYVCQFNPESLSTQFNDWIQGNLLELEAKDVERITFDDTRVYEDRVTGPGGAFLTTPDGKYVTQVVPRPRLSLAVRWQADPAGWSLGRFVEYRGGQPVDSGLLENESLNVENLNAVRDTLNQIKILDIEEIKGIEQGLRIDASLVSDLARKQSLRAHGFYARAADGESQEVRLLAKEGGLTVTMKDGIRYTLRFGAPAGLVKEGRESKLNRYLLVTVGYEKPETPEPGADGENPSLQLERRARTLNARYRWYYVISEDVYKRLHLSRFEIIQEREGEPGFDIDAFRRLEREGIEGPVPQARK